MSSFTHIKSITLSHLRLTFYINFLRIMAVYRIFLLNSFSSVQLKNYRAWTKPEYPVFLYKSVCSNNHCGRKEMCRTVCFTATFTDLVWTWIIQNTFVHKSTSVATRLSQFCDCVGKIRYGSLPFLPINNRQFTIAEKSREAQTHHNIHLHQCLCQRLRAAWKKLKAKTKAH